MNQSGFIRLIIFLVVLVLAYFFVSTKTSESLPGDLFYPIKEVKETLDISLYQLDSEGKALKYLEYTEIRFSEVLNLIEQKRSDDDIKYGLDKLTVTQEKAWRNLDRSRSYRGNITSKAEEFEEILNDQYDVLFDLRYQVRPTLLLSIENAMQKTKENLENLRRIK